MFKSRLSQLSFAFALSVALLSTHGNLFAQKNKLVQAQQDPFKDDTITTAKQLIAQIESGLDPMAVYLRKRNKFSPKLNGRLVKLSAEEKAKAIKLLREKFPFQSLRKRLEFQGDYEPKEDVQPSSKPQGSLYFGKPRVEALKLLHSQEVDSFIEREGQGLSRMRVITPYDLKPMKFADRLNAAPVDSSLKGEAVIPMRRERASGVAFKKYRRDENHWVFSPDGLPSEELVGYYHMQTAGEFAARTGLVKSIDQVAGFEPHQVRIYQQIKPPQLMNWASTETNKELAKKLEPQRGIEWRTNRIELIGMLMHDEPTAYVSDRLPNMEELSSKDAETRRLSDFEREALETLKNDPDEEAVVRGTLNRILMVGAIRANRTCLECHKGKEGDMMGAFSYEFLRHPRVEE